MKNPLTAYSMMWQILWTFWDV